MILAFHDELARMLRMNAPLWWPNHLSLDDFAAVALQLWGQEWDDAILSSGDFESALASVERGAIRRISHLRAPAHAPADPEPSREAMRAFLTDMLLRSFPPDTLATLRAKFAE